MRGVMKWGGYILLALGGSNVLLGLADWPGAFLWVVSVLVSIALFVVPGLVLLKLAGVLDSPTQPRACDNVDGAA